MQIEGALIMARIYQSAAPLEKLKLKIKEILQNDINRRSLVPKPLFDFSIVIHWVISTTVCT